MTNRPNTGSTGFPGYEQGAILRDKAGWECTVNPGLKTPAEDLQNPCGVGEPAFAGLKFE